METAENVLMREGTLIDYRLRIHGIRVRWRTEIKTWNPPESFVDMQLKGPYKLWHHTHTFIEVEGGTRMIDEVRYEIPFGPLGDVVNSLFVGRDVNEIFRFRSARIIELMA
jgi:ligand-binding SRPBCC domain-containing protein